MFTTLSLKIEIVFKAGVIVWN